MKYREREIAPGFRHVELVFEDDEKPEDFQNQMCDCNVVYKVDNSVPHQLTWRCPNCHKKLTLKEDI